MKGETLQNTQQLKEAAIKALRSISEKQINNLVLVLGGEGQKMRGATRKENQPPQTPYREHGTVTAQ